MLFDVATQRYHLHTFSIPWGCSAVVIALCSNASINMLAMIGLMGDPMAAPLVCS